jgi:2OG-Fe(II) oxygenase superfamily
MQNDTHDFIEIYDNALDAATCAALIARFKTSNAVGRGATGGGVNTEVKNSWDINITRAADWKDAENTLNTAMLRGLLQYLRKYPYTILGPLWLKMKDPETGNATMLDEISLPALDEKRLTALAVKAFRPGAINIQRYLADEGGYPRWHCELYPSANDSTFENLHRTLLWTIYLNDGFGEGETEFFHQHRKIAPRTGSLLIAPAGFTHTHRGNMPKGGDKYIATSWILFQRGETVYAQK